MGNRHNIPPLIEQLIRVMTSREVYPDIPVVDGPSTEPYIRFLDDPKEYLNFASPNPLGLANDPRVNEAGIVAIRRYGSGTVGSRATSGNIALYPELEAELADFTGQQAAAVFNSTSYATMDILSGLMDPPLIKFLGGPASDLPSRIIFMDEESHASVYDATRLLRGVEVKVYRHCDMQHLRRLMRVSNHEWKMVLTDAYFSVTAREAHLSEICALARSFGAMVVIDDAHGVGILGPNGRGTAELLQEEALPIIIGSLAKAFGVRMGYVTGARHLIDYFRLQRRSIFSGSEPPAVVGSVLEALRLARSEPWRREIALQRAGQLRHGLNDLGLVVEGDHTIVPWLIGDEATAKKVAAYLLRQGIFAPPLYYPAAKRGRAIIRFMVMATHTEAQVQHVLDVCTHLKGRHKKIVRAPPEGLQKTA